MSIDQREELFTRYADNPILSAADWPYTVNAVFNPAAVSFEGETLLLVRVEERTGISHLAVATSADGVRGWVIEPDRVFMPDVTMDSERFGIEDPRITVHEDECLITYTGYSSGGPLVCMASTRDFRTYERRGVLMPPEDKDAAFFPDPIDGRWALLHRPVSTMPSNSAHIWLSWSPDLKHWGDHEVLLQAREGAWWDAAKIGLGPPPMLTDRGWLILYHGVRVTAAGSIYRVGVALLDRADPRKLLARSNEWIFGPNAPYEIEGDVDQVVFPCGWILREDGDTIDMYYGAADTSVGLATGSLKAILEWLDAHSVAR